MNPLMEGLFLFSERNTNEEILQSVKRFGKEFGVNIIELHLHRDEGYYNRDEEWIPNLHGHFVFENIERRDVFVMQKKKKGADKGKEVKMNLKGRTHKFNKTETSKMQDFFAEHLGLKRGKSNSREHLTHIEWKNKKIREEYEEIKAEIKEKEQLNLQLEQEIGEKKGILTADLSLKDFKEQSFLGGRWNVEKLQSLLDNVKILQSENHELRESIKREVLLERNGLKEAYERNLHKDYLGSILAISDEEGNSIEQRHYDAWGNMTHLQIGNGAVLTGEELERAKAQMFLDRGYTSHEHFWEVGIIHMNGRLYDPLLRRFLNADENIQDPHNTQNYNKYGYVFNNPLIYNDPSGEFFFAALAPILGKVLAGIITGAVVGATIGAGSYLLNATITGNFSLKDFGRSILMGAVTGAVSGGIYNASLFTAGFSYTNHILGSIVASVLPAWEINIGDFNFSISPSIAIGKGWGFGANVSATFHAEDFAISGGFGIMHYGSHAGSGEKGWEYKKSAMVTYDDGKFGVSLGTNKWSGLHSQQTGIVGLRHGDFSMSYENDGSPFDKVKRGLLGDGHDRWRTAAMRFGIGEFSAGFNLFTGERNFETYDYGWDNQMMNYVKNNGAIRGIGGATYPYGFAYEKGPYYRLGAAYIGWGNYRIGIDSDRYVRHPIQNILAHGKLSPQPALLVLSNKINPYFQYHTKNKFTLW